MAAQAMLRYRLLEDRNDSPLTRKATAFYTNLMLKNRNPNAVVILKALNRLEGHWSEAHIAEAAGTAAQAARTEFAEQANCKSCQTLEDLREVMPGSQISGNTNSAMKATDRLEAISKR